MGASEREGRREREGKGWVEGGREGGREGSVSAFAYGRACMSVGSLSVFHCFLFSKGITTRQYLRPKVMLLLDLSTVDWSTGTGGDIRCTRQYLRPEVIYSRRLSIIEMSSRRLADLFSKYPLVGSLLSREWFWVPRSLTVLAWGVCPNSPCLAAHTDIRTAVSLFISLSSRAAVASFFSLRCLFLGPLSLGPR